MSSQAKQPTPLWSTQCLPSSAFRPGKQTVPFLSDSIEDGRFVSDSIEDGRFVSDSIEDGRFEYAPRTEAIAREAQLDGFYILRTSEPEDRLATPDVVRSYKNLTNVERAFRSLKTVDLQIRPIRHRAETRVRSHLFLCLLSYYVQWHLRRALAPLLFDDEDLDAHRARRDPVLKAESSASAKRKKTKRETEDGLPIHSFKTLLAEMATRARHQCRTASDPDGPRLHRLTEPTPLQRRALELVKMFPVDN